MQKLVDAIVFAARQHSGQFRKDGRTPYINHPLEVMGLLVRTAFVSDEEILIAAVLHDVIEDTAVTGKEMADRFGESVTRIVLELTDDKTLSKSERKRQQLLSVEQLSPPARLVRISDKICNVYDILYAPPGDWDIERRKDYLEWANAVVDRIRGTNALLEKKFDELYREGSRFLGE